MTRMAGLVTGIVKDVDDPDNQGRIQVDYPAFEGRSRTAWMPIAMPMAGNNRGFAFMPELDDEAVVGFLSGDVDQPVVLGFTWNGKDASPSSHPRERIIRSYNGHVIRMIDSPKGAQGSGSITIEDANGNKVVMSNGKIRLDAVAVVEIHAPVVTIGGPGWQRVVTPNQSPL
ncbi:phage baseplate assembly protein V [Flavisphingomonas formosensis]|uniref:phage baseplate assembly protein V n=1 Tax=Flavisphingomonas formosensis TaxID=861534 RepID=UPI0012F7A040|nr:phage baseplate assembly protein V [Sphingomonas formosensis]